MRAAVCRYVECLAIVRQPLDKGPGPATGPKSLRSSLLASVEDSLKHPTADIRDAAVRALGQFALAYMCKGNPEAGAKRLVVKLAGTLREDPNPAARRGAALALGVMPATLLLAEVPPPVVLSSVSGTAGGAAAAAAAAAAGDNGGDGDHGDREGAAGRRRRWRRRLALDALKAATVPETPSSRRRGAHVCGAGIGGFAGQAGG